MSTPATLARNLLAGHTGGPEDSISRLMGMQDRGLAYVDKLSISIAHSCGIAIPGTVRDVHQNGTLAQHS
jgi:hypothetical protein